MRCERICWGSVKYDHHIERDIVQQKSEYAKHIWGYILY